MRTSYHIYLKKSSIYAIITSIMKKLLPIFTIIICLILGGCTKSSSDKAISKSGFYFDTIIEVTLYDSKYEYALDECMQMAEEYEGYFSDTKKDSDVYRINSHPNEPVEVSDATIELVNLGMQYSAESNGTFDICVGKLTDLWTFEDDNDFIIPDRQEVISALENVNYNNIHIDGNTVTLSNDNCAIDLGGIAKGYIADKMKEYLKKEGVDSALINLGGNVLTIGTKKDNSKFTIGIQKPFSDDGTPILSIDIADKSVVTSGTYQRYAEIDGVLYHHIIDLKTGFPANNNLSSVSIICDSSTKADAYSTMIFLMGLNEGLQFVEENDDLEAIFIDNENNITYSSGLGDTIPYKEY